VPVNSLGTVQMAGRLTSTHRAPLRFLPLKSQHSAHRTDMDTLSYSTCVSAAAGALVAYTTSVAIYRLFFSPLKDLPGPWYTKISNVWLSINELSLRQCRAIDDLFAKYGPVVQLGPNKVGFIDMTAAKNAYTRFPKDDYYLHLSMNGISTTFTTQCVSMVSTRRRAY